MVFIEWTGRQNQTYLGFGGRGMASSTFPAAKIAPPLPCPFRGGRSITSNKVISVKRRVGRALDNRVLVGEAVFLKDYSGHALMDQVLTSFQGGPFAQYRINKSEKWPLYVTAHGSVATVTEKIKSEIQLGARPEIEQFKLKATNVGIRPGVMLGHAIGVFNFQFGFGAEFRSNGKLKDDEDQYFRTSDGKDLTAQWNGWRMTLGVGIVL